MNDAERDLDLYETRLRLGTKYDWQKSECVGFYQYGMGRTAAAANEMMTLGGMSQMESPCTSCPKSQECWEATKERAKEVFPELVAHFEELAQEYDGPDLILKYNQSLGMHDKGNMTLDPYMALSMINFRIGAEHQAMLEAV